MRRLPRCVRTRLRDEDHQWIVFRGNRGTEGMDVLEGMAIVFGSLDSVKEKFQKFYDLLSHEGVSEYRYRAIFHEEDPANGGCHFASE